MADNELVEMARGNWTRMMRRGNWEFMTRTNTSGAVLITAITADDKLVLVEQYRPPFDKIVLECPAGLAGDTAAFAGEALADAARRELLEETGYEAEEMVFLTEGPPSPALNDEILTFFLARGLKKVGPGGGDETENITVHEVPMAELDTWLTDQRATGKLIDPKIFIGLAFAGRNPKHT